MRSLIVICLAVGSFATSSAARADGEVAAGEKVFGRCFSCHSIGAPDPAKKGPTLKDIVGRPIASVAGYSYSEALKARATPGAVWDAGTLEQFLKDPSGFAKGTKMTAPPVRRESERSDLIAYLTTLH